MGKGDLGFSGHERLIKKDYYVSATPTTPAMALSIAVVFLKNFILLYKISLPPPSLLAELMTNKVLIQSLTFS